MPLVKMGPRGWGNVRASETKKEKKKLKKAIKKMNILFGGNTNYQGDAISQFTPPTVIGISSSTNMGWSTITSATVSVLTNIAVGDGAGARTGPNIILEKLSLKYKFSPHGAITGVSVGQTGLYLRVILLHVKEFTQAFGLGAGAYTYADLFQIPPATTMADAHFLAPFRQESKGNFHVLYDRIHQVPVQGIASGMPTFGFGKYSKKWKSGHKISYSDDTNLIGSLNEGHIFMLAFTNENAVASALGLVYMDIASQIVYQE